MGFYVYIHKRPDGRPFYVGKGTGRRAFDFSPSRRTLHHQNIVRKYGRDNIVVEVIPCDDEASAFGLEKALISEHRPRGLVNLTDGGEGAAGHVANERQQAALAKGRGKGRFGAMDAISQRNILDGLARGRSKFSAFIQTAEGKEHLRKNGQKARQVPRKPKTVVCAECGEDFTTTTSRAKCCSRKCEQRHRRAKEKLAAAPKPAYKHTASARSKMSTAIIARVAAYQRPAVCAHCSLPFSAKTPRAIFCCRSCSNAYHNARRKYGNA